MRDPARIDPLIEHLRSFWKAHPDWRLGQILGNAANMHDPFYAEDDVIERGLRELEARP